jgi:Protein of unknown function (DUF4242)
MALLMIERNFAEQLQVTQEAAVALSRINTDVGVQWLFSFLSADKKKTYCLYEASSAEALHEAAKRANIPADTIIEVSGVITTAGDVRGIDTLTPPTR